MHARDAETHRRDGEDHLPASETHRRDGEDHLPASETHRRDARDHLPASELYLLDAEDAPPRRGVLGPCRFSKKVDRLDPPPSHIPPRTTGRAWCPPRRTPMRKDQSMSKKTQTSKDAALARQFIAGIGKNFANAESMAFGSATLTPAELTKRLQTLVDLRTAVKGPKATPKAKLADETTQAPALLGLLTEFESFVKVTFSKSPDVLADFGLKPRKSNTPLTVEQKAAAVAKRKATREARHTMGKVQKQTVTGHVVDVVVTPVTAPTPVA